MKQKKIIKKINEKGIINKEVFLINFRKKIFKQLKKYNLYRNPRNQKIFCLFKKLAFAK